MKSCFPYRGIALKVPATMAIIAALPLFAATGCQKNADVAGGPAPGASAAPQKTLTPEQQAAIQSADAQGPAIHAANAAPPANNGK